MKRNLICLAAALALVLSACSRGQQSVATDPPAAATQPGAEYDSFVFPVPAAHDYVLAIDQDMADVLSALGEAQSYFESPSSAFDGLDKTYTYSGFCVTTRPEVDRDYVNSILLLDNSVTTAEGVSIGAAKDDVTAVYGEGDDQGTAITYNKGDSSLTFIFGADDTVISIEYLPL